MSAHEYLKQYFGYDTFRSGQETMINAILSGEDVLGVMPTGAGKSLCFQVPALMMSGVAIIVSPLISLMKDQVNALTRSGVAAAFINSSLTDRQMQKVMQNAGNGEYKLIYVAPERLLSQGFLHLAQSGELSMLAVDEAHCISQWGHDFRPSYSRIPDFIAKLNKRPVVAAFTATATTAVREDIIRLLGLIKPTTLTTGFDRQNLRFEVQRPKYKFSVLKDYLDGKRELCGIIYCSTRNAVEDVCMRLNHSGFNASRYHAGLHDDLRRGNQDDFLHDSTRLMVATNAFGMGINKPNVSFVIHYNMPMNLENYYQEAGRAGRDGRSADCVLLYDDRDVQTNLWLIKNADRAEEIDMETKEKCMARDRSRLQEMRYYCSTTDCLRGHILKYFGEKPPKYCGNCSNCGTDLVNFSIIDFVKRVITRIR